MTAKYIKKMIPRSELQTRHLSETVSEIIQRVRQEGDKGLRYYMKMFDGWSPDSFRITQKEIDKAAESLSAEIRHDIGFLHNQVQRFAKAQFDRLSDFQMETLPGVTIGQRYIPVQSVGAYVPGGRYTLLASTQMSVVPAKVAGVKRVIACVPPKDGKINPAVLYSLGVAGVDEVYSLAGAQAMAAMAFGTSEMKPVDMITGPGTSTLLRPRDNSMEQSELILSQDQLKF